jgi:hypothetical protein
MTVLDRTISQLEISPNLILEKAKQQANINNDEIPQ